MRQVMKAGLALVLMGAGVVSANDQVDLDMVTKIREEGFRRSHVMETLQHLTDEIGPRLTGSPAMRLANDWTRDKFTEWGLKDARLEGFEFGPGWTPVRSEIHLTSPRAEQLYGLPIAWHPGTEGRMEGEIVVAPMKSAKDFDKYKGKLKGKIVLVDAVPEKKEPSNKVFTRLSDADLKDETTYNLPTSPQADLDSWIDHVAFGYERDAFLQAEGAVAMVSRSRRTGNLIDASGYQYKQGMLPKLPAVSLAAEDYGMLVRLSEADDKRPVKISLDVAVTYHNEDMKSYSTLADIPGKAKNAEIVMAGAHLDSWRVGDGAVDNGAGTAVVMEAARILKALGVQPKRTIRFALWGGEEQGYYGSQRYVIDHLADRPTSVEGKLKYLTPYEQQFGRFPISFKPGYEKFSVYFNLDNGSGKIRGIYTEGNARAAAIFGKWFEPFHDLGAATISMNETGGTDHEPFDDIGLPGFQFIQEPLDYGTRTHHTQIDTLENAYEDDLKQASVIMATFLYEAAMRDERFPRKPMPVQEGDQKDEKVE